VSHLRKELYAVLIASFEEMSVKRERVVKEKGGNGFDELTGK